MFGILCSFALTGTCGVGGIDSFDHPPRAAAPLAGMLSFLEWACAFFNKSWLELHSEVEVEVDYSGVQEVRHQSMLKRKLEKKALNNVTVRQLDAPLPSLLAPCPRPPLVLPALLPSPSLSRTPA